MNDTVTNCLREASTAVMKFAHSLAREADPGGDHELAPSEHMLAIAIKAICNVYIKTGLYTREEIGSAMMDMAQNLNMPEGPRRMENTQ